METKRLVRPKEGRILFGVAAGLANYFNIDVAIVRILFVILALWGGSGILLYIVGILLIPEENGAKPGNSRGKKNNRTVEKEKLKNRVQTVASDIRTSMKKNYPGISWEQTIGIIILIIGLLLLGENMFSWLKIWRLWPLAIIIAGIIIIVNNQRRSK